MLAECYFSKKKYLLLSGFILGTTRKIFYDDIMIFQTEIDYGKKKSIQILIMQKVSYYTQLQFSI